MKLIEIVRKHMAASKTRAELNRLTDRELADIGIFRCDIPQLVRP